MNSTSSSRLPRFDQPPVIETFLGVQFTPITGWDIPFFGIFWETIREQYPKYKVAPYLITPPEELEPSVRSNVSISLSMAHAQLRLWFYNATET